MDGSPTPPAPEPDTKDWTWVIEKPCPECGFDAAQLDRDDVGAMLRANAEQWTELLEHPLVAQRPAPTTWSGLEYACHVRDVCLLYLQRLDRMLAEDGPHYDNWDQDATAIEQRYDLQDPATVASELVDAAEALADRFEEVSGDGWERTGFRGDGAAFTVESFARYLIHDPVHHVDDVRKGYASLSR